MKCIKLNAILTARLVKMLWDGPCTLADLCEETGLHYVTVREYCSELHRAGVAHIPAWEKDSRGRDLIKVYKLGPGKDAKRAKMTRPEISARYRAKRAAAQLLAVQAGRGTLTAKGNGRLAYTRNEALEVCE